MTHFVHYAPGFYVGIVSQPGRIDAVVDIVDPNGTPLDQFTVAGGYGGLSQGENARGCARAVGFDVGRYIKMRSGR